MTETEHQIMVICWTKKVMAVCSDTASDFFCESGREELDLLFHIPNGGSRSKREGAIFKAMGVKPGVPDLCLPVPSVCGRHNNLWIEMKTDDLESGKGKVSPDQQKWHQALETVSGKVVVARHWKEATAAIREYLGGAWPDIDMAEMEKRLTAPKIN